MFYVLQNESTAALRRVPILLTDAATGTTAQTGIAITNIYPYVNINGGAFAGGAGTVAEAGYGQYYYEFDASEVATLGLAGIHITASGCRDYDAICQVAAFNMYSGGGVGISAGDVWNYDISTTVTAGTAGSQLNTAASGGAGLTAGDVWEYVLISTGNSADSTLGDAKQYALQADTQTQATNLRPAVWDFDINSGFATTTIPYPLGYIIQAGDATTTAAASVWNYDISGVSGAGLAGTQLNLAALPSAGSGLTAGDVWDFNVVGFGATGSAAITLTQTLFTVGNTETYLSNQTPIDIWSFNGVGGRSITGGIADTVTSVINTVDISTQSVTDIWSEDVSGYSTPSAGYDLTQAASGGAGISAYDVWNYASRTITGGIADTVTLVSSPVDITTPAMAGVANTVWNYATRTLTSAATGISAYDVWEYAGGRTITGGTITTNNDKTGYSLSGTQSFNLTGNITGNLSGSVGSVTNAVDITTNSMSGTAGSVWSYATRTLTSAAGATAGDIWSYAGGRTITGGSVTSVVDPVTLSGTTMASIGNSVWDDLVASHTTNGTFGKLVLRSDQQNKAGDVTLYSSGGVNGVDADMHRIANDTAAATALKNALTGIGASWTGNVVGNVTGTVDDVVQPVDVSTTSMSGIANTVWSAGTKTITGGTVDTVTNPVSVSTTSMTGIAGTVWTYGTRTLTSAATGITAGDVWTYNISGISASGSAGKQLNDASVSGSVVTIVNGPYRLTSIAEGTDGRIDILADSVQTIQLNCLDGFGQPFNITGYTAAVNVYDVSGALADTYVPTVDFASSGILSFDIDTTITGTTGRYTLVVELTSGAEVVQLGPLEILVRPL